MASSIDFVQYIVDQCSGAGDIVAKKMFGDYGIYCGGKIFGLICDDKFYLKPTNLLEDGWQGNDFCQSFSLHVFLKPLPPLPPCKTI